MIRFPVKTLPLLSAGRPSINGDRILRTYSPTYPFNEAASTIDRITLPSAANNRILLAFKAPAALPLSGVAAWIVAGAATGWTGDMVNVTFDSSGLPIPGTTLGSTVVVALVGSGCVTATVTAAPATLTAGQWYGLLLTSAGGATAWDVISPIGTPRGGLGIIRTSLNAGGAAGVWGTTTMTGPIGIRLGNATGQYHYWGPYNASAYANVAAHANHGVGQASIAADIVYRGWHYTPDTRMRVMALDAAMLKIGTPSSGVRASIWQVPTSGSYTLLATSDNLVQIANTTLEKRIWTFGAGGGYVLAPDVEYAFTFHVPEADASFNAGTRCYQMGGFQSMNGPWYDSATAGTWRDQNSDVLPAAANLHGEAKCYRIDCTSGLTPAVATVVRAGAALARNDSLWFAMHYFEEPTTYTYG